MRWFPWRLDRRGMRVGGGARSAPLGGGEGREGVRGNRGNPGLWGGFPGPRALAGFPGRQDRRGIRARCRAPSPVMGAAGSVVAGRQEGDLGGTPEPGRLGCSGGVPGFPPVFQSPFPCCLLLTEQSCSVPDLALLLFEGVWGEHGGGAAPPHHPRQQGVWGRDGPAQRPHTPERGLYAHYACIGRGCVRAGARGGPGLPGSARACGARSSARRPKGRQRPQGTTTLYFACTCRGRACRQGARRAGRRARRARLGWLSAGPRGAGAPCWRLAAICRPGRTLR